MAATSHIYATAGTASLKVRLTAAGRRALKRARSLKLAVVTTFTPTTGTPVTTIAHVRVSARTRASGG